MSAFELTPYLIPELPHVVRSVRIPSEEARLQSIKPVSICHLPRGTVHGPVDLLGRSGQIGCSPAAAAEVATHRSKDAMTQFRPIARACTEKFDSSSGAGAMMVMGYCRFSDGPFLKVIVQKQRHSSPH